MNVVINKRLKKNCPDCSIIFKFLNLVITLKTLFICSSLTGSLANLFNTDKKY